MRGSVTGIGIAARVDPIFTAASTKMTASEHRVRKDRESSQVIFPSGSMTRAENSPG